ncbi:MAG: DUF4115 domain-containing protein [Rubellimicrobium sp.]|nr:DUF4115 domain-containing protein [Rubellimicrobium sp.]
MIGRTFWRGTKAVAEEEPNAGFDAFELRLGDLMRGERATMGKSLLDVQRELKIKATYIAAIENADPSAFATPGFIAGYVRSYARYLDMDPDWAFEKFCRESGFQTAHGMSTAASPARPSREERLAGANGLGKDIFASPTTPFQPPRDGFLSGFEPRAAGSVLVLAVLVAALGYGAWTVLREVQKVEFAPVEQAPTVIAEVDPLAGASRGGPEGDEIAALSAPLPSAESLDRLYRPQALDLPVFVPRDGPIGTLAAATPEAPGGATGAVAGDRAGVDDAVALALGGDDQADAAAVPAVQVTEGPAPEVQLLAVRPAWVRVTASDGSVLFEGILDAGDRFDVPATEEPPRLRVGESGALYLALNGVAHGPVGPSGTVKSNVALDAASIGEAYQVADLSQDAALAEIVRVAQAGIVP